MAHADRVGFWGYGTRTACPAVRYGVTTATASFLEGRRLAGGVVVFLAASGRSVPLWRTRRRDGRLQQEYGGADDSAKLLRPTKTFWNNWREFLLLDTARTQRRGALLSGS